MGPINTLHRETAPKSWCTTSEALLPSVGNLKHRPPLPLSSSFPSPYRQSGLKDKVLRRYAKKH